MKVTCVSGKWSVSTRRTPRDALFRPHDFAESRSRSKSPPETPVGKIVASAGIKESVHGPDRSTRRESASPETASRCPLWRAVKRFPRISLPSQSVWAVPDSIPCAFGVASPQRVSPITRVAQCATHASPNTAPLNLSCPVTLLLATPRPRASRADTTSRALRRRSVPNAARPPHPHAGHRPTVARQSSYDGRIPRSRMRFWRRLRRLPGHPALAATPR
jgi:hypothetical protein